jgi:hypothetical protein
VKNTGLRRIDRAAAITDVANSRIMNSTVLAL